jgi:hypothetical protein
MGMPLWGPSRVILRLGREDIYSASAESRRRGGRQTLGLARSRRGTCGCKRRARPIVINLVMADSQPGIVLFNTATCAGAGWLMARCFLDDETWQGCFGILLSVHPK